MKISIITATFNSSETIMDTVNSVSKQNYTDYEHIIVDGRSSDDTILKIKESNKQNIKIYSETDEGIYDAFNKGILHASGDVVGFLNSDDMYIDNNVLYDIAEVFLNTGCDASYGDLVYTRWNNVNKIVRYWKSGEFSYEKIQKGWMPPHPTFYMKKDKYEEHGIFNTDYCISADYENMLRNLTRPEIKVSYIPRVLIKMRSGGKSNQGIYNIILKTMEDFSILKVHNNNPLKAIINKNFSKLKQFKFNTLIGR
jgi:glycosyltransferase